MTPKYIQALMFWKAWGGRFLDIRPQERRKTWIMFFYFFCIIATNWMLKPIRNSLFLDELGAKNLRYVYIGEGLFLMGVVWIFIQFSKRVSRKALYHGILLASIGSLVLFWFLFRIQVPYLSALFYVWAASYSIVMTTQFFTLANDIFNPLEAKRLFGIILSGGSIGGVLGGVLTAQLVGWVGTENLLFVIALIIGGCDLLIMKNWRYLIRTETSNPAKEKENREDPKSRDEKKTGRELLFGSSYLLMLLAIIILAKMGSTVVDNHFNEAVESAILGKNDRTAFFGHFFSFLNAFSFAMQFFITGLVLKFLGVGISLWILPAGLAILSGATIIFPLLLTACLFKTFDGSVNYSIQQATREVLYLPVSSSVRYRVKPVIDMLGYRLAKSLGGVYIALMVPLFQIRDDKLGILVLALLPIWFFCAWRMKAGYSKMLRHNLLEQGGLEEIKEPQKAMDVLGAMYDEKTLHQINALLEHRSTYLRKLASTAFLLYEKSGKDIEAARKSIHRYMEREAFVAPSQAVHVEDPDFIKLEDKLLKLAEERKAGTLSESEQKKFSENILPQLAHLIQKPEKSLKVKRRAIKMLELMPSQESVNLLLKCSEKSEDHTLRYVIVKGLNRLHDLNPSLMMERAQIKNEINRDADIFLSASKLKVYFNELKPALEHQNHLDVSLTALQDESIERIFYFLDLLYPHEIIRIIHDRIMDHQENEMMRSHAIELLNNTLEPDMLILLQKVFEKRKPLRSIQESEAASIIEKWARSPDQWLHVVAVFAITESKLDSRRPELAAAAQETETLLF